MQSKMSKSKDCGDWQWQWRHRLAGLTAIGDFLALSEEDLARRRAAAERYPPLATPYYLSLANPTDTADPILRQVLPDPAEIEARWTADPDPLAEQADSPVPGVVRRYPDRALLLLTARCAVHCRHCLRKRNWGRRIEWNHGAADQAFDYLEKNREIREVILSGGDPLLLEQEKLQNLLERLGRIEHVAVVRIGSRLPTVMPQRFTEDFCEMLGARPGRWLATHFNHPRELTDESGLACRRLLRAGVGIINQTVLLKGVNDNAEIIRELGLGLLRIGVKPYYLFHGDPVAGTRHFRTGVRRGLQIISELRGRVSGLAIPTFAIDLPGGGGKVALTPETPVVIPGQPGGDEDFLFSRLDGEVCSYGDDGSG